MKLLVLVIFIILGSATQVTAQGWRGIVPLRSTRSDVERLLGQPRRACPCEPSAHGMCSCAYETSEALINVDYAVSPCVGYPAGWNVPADTVLRISIRWELPRAFSEFQIDVGQFEKALDDTLTTYYASREKGVEYTVSSDKKLSSTTYFPTLKEAYLRCPCSPVLDHSTQRSIHFDAFEFRSVEALLQKSSLIVAAASPPDVRQGLALPLTSLEILGLRRRFGLGPINTGASPDPGLSPHPLWGHGRQGRALPHIRRRSRSDRSKVTFEAKPSVDENVLARLDNYVIAVSQRDAWRGYVMLYRAKLASARTLLRHRQALAKHIYGKRRFSAKQIVIVDAGYRDELTIELFMISQDLAPPEPRATWRPCKQRSRQQRAG